MDKEMEKGLIQAVPLARRGTPGGGSKRLRVSGVGRSELYHRRSLRGGWRNDHRERAGGRSGAAKIAQRTGRASWSWDIRATVCATKKRTGSSRVRSEGVISHFSDH